MKILLGSNNKHKQDELQKIFDKKAPGQIKLLIPNDILDEELDVIEDGDTLKENAFKKAFAFNLKSGLPCIADDTGLEIDALNGKPGVHSARFSGVHGDDKANRLKALSLLQDTPDKKRTARFRTVICFYTKGKDYYVDGVCNGKIIHEERGTEGFGYDSIFVPDGFDKTFAEMDQADKNELSHRANAAKNFIDFIINNNFI